MVKGNLYTSDECLKSHGRHLWKVNATYWDGEWTIPSKPTFHCVRCNTRAGMNNPSVKSQIKSRGGIKNLI